MHVCSTANCKAWWHVVGITRDLTFRCAGVDVDINSHLYAAVMSAVPAVMRAHHTTGCITPAAPTMHPAVRMVPRTSYRCGVCGTPSTRSSSLPSLFHIYERCSSFFLHPAAERNDRRDECPSPLQINSQPRHFSLHNSLIHCRTALIHPFFFPWDYSTLAGILGVHRYSRMLCPDVRGTGITKAQTIRSRENHS